MYKRAFVWLAIAAASPSLGAVACGGGYISRNDADAVVSADLAITSAPYGAAGIAVAPTTERPATHVLGKLQCKVPNAGGTLTGALPFVPINFGGQGGTTKADGSFDIVIAPSSDPNVLVTLTYDGQVATSENGAAGAIQVASHLQVMDESHSARSGTVVPDIASRATGTLDLGIVVVSSLDCELWRIGANILKDYHGVKKAAPPGGQFRILRWSYVNFGTPYTLYDYVNIRTDLLGADGYVSAWIRERMLFHEFGHVVRDVFDGDLNHWNWDDFRWAYARSHDGTEIFNKQYAFHEGWGDYWSQAREGARTPRGSANDPSPDHLDWNEDLIANRLLELAAMLKNSGGADTFDGADRILLETLENSPGAIHSIYEFEQALHARQPNFIALRDPPPPCPPGYTNDGATCRLWSVVAKAYYGRGVGTVPDHCGPGQEMDAWLCYSTCGAGFHGVGPVCWQSDCPAGYRDDGADCFRDAQIVSSDNQRCPFYDICGAWHDCTTCPSGWQDDGCTCRINADLIWKQSYGRGVGTVPTGCADGQEYDAGLCYPTCTGGFSGVGPVCWGGCPSGYHDDGATCSLLSILVQY